MAKPRRGGHVGVSDPRAHGRDAVSEYTILTGDCIEAMRAMQPASIDAIVTDPPYGTEGEKGYGRSELWDGGITIANDADLSILDAALPEMRRVLKPDAWLAIFISPRKQLEARQLVVGHGIELFGECVWDKREAGLGHPIRYAHETVLICRVGNPPAAKHALLSSYTGRAPFRTRREHPHEKPLAFIRELVRWCCPEGGTVLDPFAGSGTTGVATILEKRHAILIETDPKWAERAAQRCRYTTPASDPDSLFSFGETA